MASPFVFAHPATETAKNSPAHPAEREPGKGRGIYWFWDKRGAFTRKEKGAALLRREAVPGEKVAGSGRDGRAQAEKE